MKSVFINPAATHPLYSTTGTSFPTPPELGADVAAKTKALFSTEKKSKPDDARREGLKDRPTAYAVASFLKAYGQQVALDVVATRAAITAKLMEIADCGDTKFELRALELLGKHSDIGLFTERSEVTINYKTPEALEDAIKERVRRLLHSEMINVTPKAISLEDELREIQADPLEIIENAPEVDLSSLSSPVVLTDRRWGKSEDEEDDAVETDDFEDDDE